MNIGILTFAIVAAALTQTAGAITATKEYVDRKDATNAAAIAELASNALTRREAIAGFTEWKYSGPPTVKVDDLVYTNSGSVSGWLMHVTSSYPPPTGDVGLGRMIPSDPAATNLVFDFSMNSDNRIVTATRVRLPTMGDLAPPGIGTNDVCNIVTNATTYYIASPQYNRNWEVLQNDAMFIMTDFRWDGQTARYTCNGTEYALQYPVSAYTTVAEDRDVYLYTVDVTNDIPHGSTPDVWHLNVGTRGGFDGDGDYYFAAYTRNALGLARLEDIPTNHVTKADLDQAIADIPVPEIDTSTLAKKSELQAVSNEAQVVYRLYSGSNVVCEVTNYNSAVHAPTLRLLQLNESNEYFTVWTETNGLARTLAAANSNTAERVNFLRDLVASNYAPRAWSRVTSGLGAEAPSNTTWISTPTTVIAGGLEYSKVVHANGAVWVLSGNGMMNFDPTTNAYLRISADDGTEIFSIEKTDAVTVGAYADGITLNGNIITIPVNVVSANHPTMFFREQLDSGEWEDESSFHPVHGGFVNWSGTSGAWVCSVTFDWQPPSSMFLKFTYEQPGSTIIRNNAAMDAPGGILCTDGVHKCRPVYSNGSITWEVVP